MRPPRAAVPTGVRLFAAVARWLLPSAFRRHYGVAIVDAFTDCYRDAAPGWPRRWVLVREIGLLVLVGIRAAWEYRREARPAPWRRAPWSGNDLGADVRLAVRTLFRQPAFSLFAVTTLALAIGSNTAIFSVVKGVLLTPPSFPEPDRIVHLFETSPLFRRGVVSPANYQAWAQQDDVFIAIAAVRSGQYHLDGEGGAERLHGRRVTPDFFRVMGVPAMHGRVLDGDDGGGTAQMAVIGHDLWQRQFGGDSSAVGGTLVLDGLTYVVVGVMPPGFDHPSDTQLWTPLRMSPEQWASRRSYFLTVVARLREGVSQRAAQAAMNVVASQRARDFPDSNEGRGVNVERLHDVEVQSVRGHLWMLFGCVGLIVLIACTNVANLLLSRALGRVREMSIRAALGASRRRLVRQLMVESVVLASWGGMAGVALAALVVQVFPAVVPPSFPRPYGATIDGVVLAYTFVLCLLTSLLFGILPAVRLSRLDIADALRATAGRRRFGWMRLGHGLVVAQMALALVLLLGAGLLLRSFHRLTVQPLGFDPANLATAEIALPTHVFENGAAQAAFFSELVDRARDLPGATQAAVSNNLPFSLRWYGRDMVLDPGTGDRVGVEVMTHAVSSGYFATIGLPLRRGRPPAPSDRPDSPMVAVVNDEFVARYLGDQDPLAARLFLSPEAESPVRIIGVAGNAKHRGLDDHAEPAVYFSMFQWPAATMLAIVRTRAEPAAMAAQLAEMVRAVHPAVPVVRLSTMRDLIGQSLAKPRFYTLLLALFAGTALALAGVGVYGLVSYMAALRAREMRIRIALGARAGSVVRLVVARGLALALPGIALGLGAAVGLTRVLDSLLFEITPTDPLTFAAVTALFIALAVAASYGPARRGTRMSPVDILRSE